METINNIENNIKILQKITNESIFKKKYNSIFLNMYETLDYKIHKGLENLGNTCYNNTILQLLYHSFPELKKLIIQFYKKNKNKSNVNDKIIVSLGKLFIDMKKNNVKELEINSFTNALDFHNTAGNKCPMYKERNQQDANESWYNIFDILSETSNITFNNKITTLLCGNMIDKKTLPSLKISITQIHNKFPILHNLLLNIKKNKENIKKVRICPLEIHINHNTLQDNIDDFFQDELVHVNTYTFKKWNGSFIDFIGYILSYNPNKNFDIIKGYLNYNNIIFSNTHNNIPIYFNNTSENEIIGEHYERLNEYNTMLLENLRNLLVNTNLEEIYENNDSPGTLLSIIKSNIERLLFPLDNTQFIKFTIKKLSMTDIQVSTYISDHNVIKKKYIENPPQYLQLSLKRFHFSYSPSYDIIINKINTSVEIQNIIHIPISLSKNKKIQYKLVGIGIHTGSFGGGHYYAYCKNKIFDLWSKYNDRNVTFHGKFDTIKEDVNKQGYIFTFVKMN